MSRKRDRDGGFVTNHPVTGRHKYRDLGLRLVVGRNVDGSCFVKINCFEIQRSEKADGLRDKSGTLPEDAVA
jgi:hypothetical protein